MTTQQHRWILGGGLASGKSEVRRLLDVAGVATIDADSLGHAVLDPDGPGFAQVRDRWPGVVVDGRIDRRMLAEIVFADPDELIDLEEITHPHIFDMIHTRVEEIGGPVVVEMPVVGERLGSQWRRMVVDCRDEAKLARAVGRGMTEDDARARLAVQPSRAEWLAVADMVVPNHGSLADLEEVVSGVVDHI